MNAPAALAHLVPDVRQRTVPAALIDALKARFGERCSTALAVREQHGRDESAFTTVPPPAAVVFAESTQDVADAVKLASEHEVPVIPFGVGSSLEGHLLAVQGGISIDVGRMNRVLSINAEDLTVTVQPGVTRKQLNDEIKSTGLFFPIDPGADATIGGMSATRASGTNAVRYGTMRENVLALEVVTASGEVIRTGTRAKKSSAGYDLTRLFVGSEGTLGVITEVTVRIYPLPEAISAAICSFPTIDAAVQTTIQTIQLGVPIARVELIDANTVKMVNAYAKLGLREEHLLLMEFHGSPASVKEQAETVQEIASEHGAQCLRMGHHARRSAPACGRRGTTPTSRPSRASRAAGRSAPTPACRSAAWPTACSIRWLRPMRPACPTSWSATWATATSTFGYLIDPDKPEERETAEVLNHKLVTRALQLEGTCTGEHGVGLHKMDFLLSEAGAGAVDMMRTIKRALDPRNIMNPGKIFSL
jgi:D-lactate dehydrogenase (cytochrome)